MTCWADEQLAGLQDTYKGFYDIWYVRCYPNYYRWCARPAGAVCSTVRADSPEELAEALGTLMCQCPRHGRTLDPPAAQAGPAGDDGDRASEQGAPSPLFRSG
jgi:hypothetical protein